VAEPRDHDPARGPGDQDPQGRDPNDQDPNDQDAQDQDPPDRDPGVPGPAEHGPEADQAEIDRRWAEILADLEPLASPAAPDPLAGGVGHGSAPPHTTPDGPAHGTTMAPGPRDYTVDDGGDGDFVPPEPPALGAGRPAVVLSVLGIVGGPAALLMAAIFWPSIPGILITVFVAAFIAGAVGLFLALPRDEDRNDPGYGDGAQV
jgi:hypothetical protein